jgi:dihydroneopterin aldolase
MAGSVTEGTADRLALRGIRAVGHHGVFEHERRDGQEFVVDAVLGVDTRRAGRDDDLSLTVDYGRLSQQLVRAIVADPVDLIETLAQRLADVCLAQPLVEWVDLTVHKPQAPIEVPFDDVTLTIHRRRQ